MSRPTGAGFPCFPRRSNMRCGRCAPYESPTRNDRAIAEATRVESATYLSRCFKSCPQRRGQVAARHRRELLAKPPDEYDPVVNAVEPIGINRVRWASEPRAAVPLHRRSTTRWRWWKRHSARRPPEVLRSQRTARRCEVGSNGRGVSLGERPRVSGPRNLEARVTTLFASRPAYAWPFAVDTSSRFHPRRLSCPHPPEDSPRATFAILPARFPRHPRPGARGAG
jgi:hypothetical protein